MADVRMAFHTAYRLSTSGYGFPALQQDGWYIEDIRASRHQC